MSRFLPLVFSVFMVSGQANAQFSNTLRHLSSSSNDATLVGLSAHDIDLDGDLDALATFQSGVFWYENDGQGNFSDGNSIEVKGSPVFKPAQFRDFDGDGYPDIAAGFGWRKNLGNGNFGPESGNFWKEVSGVCDLNNDGLGDVIYQSTNVMFLERNLGAVFSPDAYALANGSNIQVWAAADLDGNQKEDLVASLTNILYWFRNEGNNTFSKIQVYTGQLKSVVAGDVDGNGKMDLLGGASGTIYWWEFDAYGNRVLRQTLTLPGINDKALVLGDLDDDGDLDIFTGGMTTPGGTLPAILRYDAAAGQFDLAPQTQPALSTTCPKAILADFDANGNPDLFAFRPGASNRFAIYLDNGTPGSFKAPTLVGEPLSYINQVLPADLDGDGDRDFIAADFLMEKVAPGNYAQRKKINLPNVDVQLADLDGDGLADAVYPKNDAVVWQRNLGGLQFGPAIQLDGFVAQNKYVGIADFDMDGDLDLTAGIGTEALANFSLLFWFENDGAGNFTEHQLEDGLSWVLSTMPLDVNADGLPDIFVERGNLQTDIWFENLGNGVFGPWKDLFTAGTTEPANVNQRMLVDLDDDGRMDMVFSSKDYHETGVFWYQNLGAGVFSDKIQLYSVDHLGSYSSPYFAVYDTDNDGHKDVVITGEYYRQIIAFRGLGGGDFAPASIIYDDLGVGGFLAIVPYDVDDDGKLDLLLGNKASNLTNINRISWLSGVAETPPDPVTCPRDLLFSVQSEIDSFPIKYPNCYEIEGNIVVYEISANGDPVIYDLSPLLGIHTVHGGVYLYRNYLQNLHGLDSLQTIGKDMEIKNNYVIASLEGLDNLRSIGGNLVIRDNFSPTSSPKLVNLNGLGGLERVEGDFWEYQQNLKSMEGLSGLQFVGGNLDIQKGKLQDLKGLENLDTIGNSLVISAVPTLKSLNGLQNLRHAGLSLTTDSLLQLQGLDNWQSGRELRLVGNKQLQSLSGIENIQQLTGYNLTTPVKRPAIWLANNPNLTDIFALDRTVAIDDDGIYILNNAGLSLCNAQAICDYLSTSPDTVSVAGNLPDCDSWSGIVMSCMPVGTNDVDKIADCQISPNPVSAGASLSIVLNSDFYGAVKIDFLSLDGRHLQTFFREKTALHFSESLPVAETLPRQFIVRVTDGRHVVARLIFSN